MKFFYEDVLKAVGEFEPWQVKMIFFLWVPNPHVHVRDAVDHHRHGTGAQGALDLL